jgi:hypothetical protein
LSLNGTATTITFTVQPGSTIYQVGVLTDSATSGSYDVSNPSLTTVEIDPGGSGLTPDTEYGYQVRARDTSPQLNETAWSATVLATSTVTDVTAPSPDPMLFEVAPFAIGDNAISMTASNAVDDSFGVEYLFTNIVNNTSSGWQSSPTWVNVGELTLVNPDFEDEGDPGTGWSFASGGEGSPSGATTTNISGNTSALMYVDGTTSGGGFAVIVQIVTNLSTTGFGGGDTVTLSADIRALAGLNGGGALLKMESWAGGTIIPGSALEVQITGATESWDNYSMEYTIASGADEVRVIAGVATAYGGANATDSYYLFDNLAVSKGVSLEPGTEYTYWVKARDTSPNKNETDWSGPASATTTGQGPFSIDSIEFVDGVGIILTWPNVVGSIYDVQYKTALTNATWVSDPGATGISSDGGSISATSTVDSASVFYQVIAE